MKLRLFRDVFVIEAKRQMSYRMDFWVSAVGGLVAGVAIPYFLWRAIFEARAGDTITSTEIGGFTFHDMLVYYISVTLISKVVRGSDLLTDTSMDIYEGGLNRYLLYPTSYLPFKYAQHLGLLAPALLQLVVFSTLFLLVLDVPPTVQITPLALILTLVSMLVANLLHFLLCFAIQLTAFWADNVWSLLVLHRLVASLLGGFMLPLALFPETAQTLLRLTPFPALFAVPVGVLTGRLTVGEWIVDLAIGIAWCVALIVLTRPIWKRGNLQYSGVGI